MATKRKGKKKKPEPIKLYEGKEVEFLDTYGGYYRIGTCYKEEKGFCWMHDMLGKRHKSNISSVKLLVSEQSNEIKP
jgi:hypothetical protein